MERSPFCGTSTVTFRNERTNEFRKKYVHTSRRSIVSIDQTKLKRSRCSNSHYNKFYNPVQ